MRRTILKGILAVLILVVFSTLLLAQQTGSIVGTVADKTGAVIVKAKVTLTNTATKDVRNTTTNNEGFFAFSGAVVGDYSVKAEMDGFQSAEESGIHLSPGDRRNLNVTLAVGTSNELVIVEANASQVQTDTGNLSSTLNAKEIRNLALQGRDVTELLKTLPGFSNSNNGLQNKNGYDTTITSIGSGLGNALTAPGVSSRAGGTDLISDGAHVLDPGCNCNATQTINADMVSEVKVTTSAYGADSVTGPVVVSAVGKSGTNEYHGGAYLHFRDSAMNSIDYNVKQNHLAKPNDRYWYPGGQFGGPVPFTKKKLIFFTAFEYYNQSFPEQTSGGILKAMLPTMSERAGHFDPTLTDNAAVCSSIDQGVINNGERCVPITSINNGGNVVTLTNTNSDVSSYIQPGALALLKLIPEPNRTPTQGTDYNYVQSLLNTNNGYMFHTKVDYSFNDTTKLYVSYNQQHELYGLPMQRWWMTGNAIAWPGNDLSSNSSRTISGSLVKVFNSTTTNEFIAGLGYMNAPHTIGNEQAVDKTAQGYPYTYPTGEKIMPSIENGYYSNDLGIPQMLDTGRVDYFTRKMQPSISDNFTKVFGTHTLKAGVTWMSSGNREANVDQGSGKNGTAIYTPIWGDSASSSMNPVLNLMLDHTGGFNYQPTTVSDVHNPSWSFYGQDEWKVNKRFTVNYGLRLTHDIPYTDATSKFGAAAFTKVWYDYDIAGGVTSFPGLRWHSIDKSVPMAGHKLDSLLYAPRFGLAYDVFGNQKTILRGGFGSYYYHDSVAGSPFAVALGGAIQSSSNLFLSQISENTMNPQGGIPSVTAFDPTDHVEPRTLTYNFTVSQQMPLKSWLEITYAGSQSDNLINPLQDINIMPLGAFTQPDPNPASSHYNQVVPIKTINDSNGADGIQQDFKPYRAYKNLSVIRHGSWANYNALQVTWSKQRGALTYNLNYTWSKTLGIGATPDPVNLHNDYGIIGSDRKNVFNASYSYEVGNRFKSRPGAVVLNGWMISGITNLQSGAPLQKVNSANFNLGGTNTLGADLNSINNTYYLGQSGGKDGTGYSVMPVLTCDPTKGLMSGQYINASCFSLPAAPQLSSNDPATAVLTKVGGQGQYQWPYLRGPAYLSSDLSLARTIKVTERQNVQIKFTAMNFLNHALRSFDQSNSHNIDLNYNNGVLKTQDTGWIYGFTNEKFGRRVMEMTLKYNF